MTAFIAGILSLLAFIPIYTGSLGWAPHFAQTKSGADSNRLCR